MFFANIWRCLCNRKFQGIEIKNISLNIEGECIILHIIKRILYKASFIIITLYTLNPLSLSLLRILWHPYSPFWWKYDTLNQAPRCIEIYEWPSKLGNKSPITKLIQSNNFNTSDSSKGQLWKTLLRNISHILLTRWTCSILCLKFIQLYGLIWAIYMAYRFGGDERASKPHKPLKTPLC